MTLPVPRLSRHRIHDLLGRIEVGHRAAHALRISLDGRTVVVRGVDGVDLAALTATVASCGGTPVTDIETRGADAVVLGPRASRRDWVRAAALGLDELTAADLAAICAVRAGFGDAAVAPPPVLGRTPAPVLVRGA